MITKYSISLSIYLAVRCWHQAVVGLDSTYIVVAFLDEDIQDFFFCSMLQTNVHVLFPQTNFDD